MVSRQELERLDDRSLPRRDFLSLPLSVAAAIMSAVTPWMGGPRVFNVRGR